jgi:hypothetical protein
LYESSYTNAEEFASTFLTTEAGHKAFSLAAQCIITCTDADTCLPFQAFQFLASVMWHEPLMIHVLRTDHETYRIAYTHIARRATEFAKPMRHAALLLFRYPLIGGRDSTTLVGPFENELREALHLLVSCGGLTAFSALFWAICTQTDPTVQPEEMVSVARYCSRFVGGLLRSQSSEPVRQLELQWLVAEATSKTGIVAGYYALFAGLDEIYHATHIPSVLTAGSFLDVLRGHGSKEMVDQAIRFPYSDCDTFPMEACWLYKYLHAITKLKIQMIMQSAMEGIPGNVKGILWAEQTVHLFVQNVVAKRMHQPEYRCAFPGCEVVGTALCPLHKCNRCSVEHYCESEHRRKHWPAHKKECVKRTPVAPASVVAPAITPPGAGVCAFPGCNVASTPKCPLRKCGRCLTVPYCWPAHQRAHWRTHKRDCIVPPLALTASDVDAALSAPAPVVVSPGSDALTIPDASSY